MSVFMAAPTPPVLTVPVAYVGGGAHEAAARRGSYGPVIVMMAVVAVLAAAALAVGRLCFGRRALGQQAAAGHYDLEAWVERTCGPCVGAAMPTQDKEEVVGGGGGEGSAAAETVVDVPPPPEGTE
ncbi:hypothetical protein HU200_067122 [Digitaria exilis]|uniref:Uncharacterized protein n=1 Tax=Digitaria exilis TaxID=1010633 RepID=A0A834ZVL2_9POAL|nr:hypothetical protein HU200_067122 [Digitaria exilis]CAB3479071.1 unnamed protein product [Digitaria exilis]